MASSVYRASRVDRLDRRLLALREHRPLSRTLPFPRWCPLGPAPTGVDDRVHPSPRQPQAGTELCSALSSPERTLPVTAPARHQGLLARRGPARGHADAQVGWCVALAIALAFATVENRDCRNCDLPGHCHGVLAVRRL